VENKKVRFGLVCVVVMIMLTLVAIHVMAHPWTVKCPRDGEDMTFDHQVGYGKDAVCWYSHNVWDIEARAIVKHEAYIACND
jgi:hypothetical protein